MELQPLVSNAGLWSVLPPLLAIVLAIATREVVFSLFLGICAGLGSYAAQAPLPAQDLPAALVSLVRGSIGEGEHLSVLVFAFFMALNTTLFYNGQFNYFLVLSLCFKYAYLILIYPYLFLVLIQIILNKDKDLNAEPVETLLKFYDEHKRLKLTIDPAALISIQADANYVILRYMDADRVKDFMLRASMKSVENTVAQRGLVRCHRSYFVNPKYVKLLRKNKEGMITAELLHPEVPSIPVSKQFYKELSELL